MCGHDLDVVVIRHAYRGRETRWPVCRGCKTVVAQTAPKPVAARRLELVRKDSA